ncbi:MmgE/PrpD family protein [Chelativorans xinjiangense]|uniref:MmgE/PrpD family protein n=1 Tax=Chelativorans xinjiangense TaxID=2681485 RepID=UPI00135A9608|nr:MmgE/PrpD family protein [Chelativorans xinjiangense]
MAAFDDFVHGLTYEDLPEAVRGHARRWLLDLVGVAVGGRRTQLAQIICDHAAEHFCTEGSSARMLFDGRSVSPAGAALAGGMTIDALDGHDGHKLTKGHVGCGVLPACLAFAETQRQDDGGEFLTALVLGYEIGTRAGIALHRTAPDYHSSGAWVTIAAAAIGARYLGLGPAATREAIGIAEYHGPRSQMMRCIDWPTMVKDGSGWGAMAGVSAAFLAEAGFTGAPAVTVEGDEVADLWSDLGSNWRICEQYYKPYPVCRWAQPAVKAALDLSREHGLASEQIERVEVATFHQAIRLAVRRPLTTEQAQYSTSFPTAVVLVRGGLGPRDVSEDAFADPEVMRLSDGMSFTEEQGFNEAFPARRLARVSLVLSDGRRLTSPPTEAPGDPERPAAHEEVRRKYQDMTVPSLGPERSAEIARLVEGLGPETALGQLLDLVTDGIGAPCQPSHRIEH